MYKMLHNYILQASARVQLTEETWMCRGFFLEQLVRTSIKRTVLGKNMTIEITSQN